MCTALRLARAQWYYLILIQFACDCLHEITADSATFAVLARQFIFKLVNYTHFVCHSCVQFRYTIKDKPNQLELWHWSVKEYLYQHKEICDMFSIFSKIMNYIITFATHDREANITKRFCNRLYFKNQVFIRSRRIFYIFQWADDNLQVTLKNNRWNSNF